MLGKGLYFLGCVSIFVGFLEVEADVIRVLYL